MKRLASVLALLTFAFGCGNSSNDSNTITVQPGESIQAAVDAAPAGSRVVVMPGEYVETHGGQAAVLIEKSLQLIANRDNGGVVKILPGPGNTEGIWVRGTPDAFVEDVLIEGFTIDGFEKNGIWTYYTRGFEILDNNVGNSDHVGIYPQLSAQGLVRNNIAYGGLDSAMWVSGSEEVRVMDLVAYAAPIGLQVNVSKAVEVERVTAYGNVTGIALTHPLASGLGANVNLAFGYHSESVRFADGEVYDNNLVNPVSTGSVGGLPRGTGMLIAGHDRAYVEDSSFTGNDYAGMLIVDYCVATGETDDDCAPDGNTVVRNTITGNGTNPPPSDFQNLASDVVVVAAGVGNCMAENTYDTTVGGETISAATCADFGGF